MKSYFFCNNALRSLFEILTWLKNFSIMNGLAFDNILTKSEKYLKEYLIGIKLIDQDTVKIYITDYGTVKFKL